MSPSHPGLSSGRLLDASGIPYPELCDRLVRLALERHADVRSYEF